jgi:hypothetical protein
MIEHKFGLPEGAPQIEAQNALGKLGLSSGDRDAVTARDFNESTPTAP